jgi:hypothetical protein
MAKVKKPAYLFNVSTAPKTWNCKEVKGLRFNYPNVFVCLGDNNGQPCGCVHKLRQKDWNMDFNGFVCNECKTVHESDKIIDHIYSGGMTSTEWVFVDANTVGIRKLQYKLNRPDGENGSLLELTKLPDEVQKFSIGDALAHSNITREFKKELTTTYRDKIDPMLLKLLELAEESYSNEWSICHYYKNLPAARDLYENNPTLFVPLMEALRGANIKYSEFEAMYPDYLLPLSKRLIKDYNPYNERSNSWRSPTIWKPLSAYKNYEALTCVVSYYQSGLISFSQMKNIINNTQALENPLFVAAFKNNFMQMESYLKSIEHAGISPRAASFDIKDHFTKKSQKYFESLGYTPEQINEAWSSDEDPLVQIINLGSMRKKRGTNAKEINP